MLALTVVLCSAVLVQSASGAPPNGLTKEGRVLWQFEALLHDNFGNRPVCASGRWGQKFTSGRCAPLAVYSRYRYVFARARDSAFHVSTKKARDFGNYPQPVLINGRNVACNARETTFLILQVAAGGFTLGCSRAGWTGR
jgi:hypothetical protein